MVFTLVSATQEFLNNKVDEDRKLQTEEKRKQEERQDQAREEEVSEREMVEMIGGGMRLFVIF